MKNTKPTEQDQNIKRIVMDGRWNGTRRELRDEAAEYGVKIRIIKKQRKTFPYVYYWYNFAVSGPRENVFSFQCHVRPEWQRRQDRER